MKWLKRALPATALAAAALTATIASAYYTDMIQETAVLIKAADISFGDKDGTIDADTDGFNDRLTPLEAGDSFDISFSAAYAGDTECYVVPRLVIKTGGFADGDILRITDGESEVYIKSAEGCIYSLPTVVSPGETITKNYRITIVNKAGKEPLSFQYDFTFAAVQKSGNEELNEKLREDGKVFYEAVEDGTDINGFSEVTDPSDTKEDGQPVTEMMYYKLTVTPKINEGFGDVSDYRWYAGTKAVSDKEVLTLVLSKKNVGDGLKVRLEAENEAGCVTSAGYIITIEDSGVAVRKET